jgi:hypothetical protein
MEKERLNADKRPEMVRVVEGLLANPPQTAEFFKLADKIVKDSMEAIIKKVEGQVSSGAPRS